MSRCTDKSDDTTLLSSSNNTAVDDMSNSIKQVTLVDVNNLSPCDITGGEEDMNSEKKCTSCEQNLNQTKSYEISSHNSASSNADIDSVSGDIVGDAREVSTCANCGKEGANNVCNKCKSVKYCNAVCKKVHKKKHKKDCEEHLRRAAKLKEEESKRAAELHDIELFKQPPQLHDDCPICFLLLPTSGSGKRYQTCCGQFICCGCIHAMDKICPFCRTPTPVLDEEVVERLQNRVEVNDAKAIFCLGCDYSEGVNGLPQDDTKALELWKRAAELGHASSYHHIGIACYFGRGVNRDMKKAVHYWELAAMRGCATVRNTLGAFEQEAGNMERALKHYMIAVGHGHSDSLEQIQKLYSLGLATKDEYAKALRLYQKYLGEVKSPQRDEAAVFNEEYKYIG